MSATRTAPRRARRTGPLVLLLPLLFLFLGVLHLFQRPPRREPAPPPGVSSPDETVAALTGELEGAAGAWLVATLVPLHADPQRQDFESRALGRRLALESGAPWRLSVRWEARTVAAGAVGPESVAVSGPAGIGLGPVEVADEDGPALVSIPAAQTPGDAPASPLRTLLAPPRGALRPGETAEWILWGRAPGADARLEGLVPAGDAVFLAATGFQGPLRLRATRVRRGEMGQPLARLERAEVGKTSAHGASEGGDGEADDDGR